MKTKNKKILITTLFIVLFIGLAVGVFFGTYFFVASKSYSTYETDIKTNIDAINSVNSSVSSLIKSTNIDIEKSPKELDDKVTSLSRIKDRLDSMNPTAKYSKSHEKLLTGLDNNIKIYRQIENILENPNAKDVDTSLEDLKKYRDQCMNNYAQVNVKDIKITLPSATNEYINYSITYIADLVKKNKSKQIVQDQNLDFVNVVDDLVSKFAPLKIDYSTYLNKVRSSGDTYDNLISTLDKNAESFENVKSGLVKVIPPGGNKLGKSVSDSLTKTLNDYSTYIKSFKYSLVNEKALVDNKTFKKETADAMYLTANSKFEDVKADYDDFLKKFADFKTSILK